METIKYLALVVLILVVAAIVSQSLTHTVVSAMGLG